MSEIHNIDDEQNTENDAAIYALGGMTNSESDKLKSIEDKHLKEKITDSEKVIEILARSASINPSPSLRPKILQKIIGNPFPSTVILSLRSRLKSTYRYAFAASILFTVSTTTALYLYNENTNTLTELNTVRNELTRNKYDISVMASKATVLDTRLALLSNPNTVEVFMKSVKKDSSAKNSHTTVYWNAKESSVHLEVHSLPSNNDSTDYQLWALVDGKPRDLGVFHSTVSPFIFRMNSTDSADAFAITLEPKGGRPSPTLENLTVLGNAPKLNIQ